MRLTPYILRLFFESPEGASLVDGFAAARKHFAAGDVGRLRKSAQSHPELELALRWSLPPEEPSAISLRRELEARRVARPKNVDEARQLYEALLDEGIAITRGDLGTSRAGVLGSCGGRGDEDLLEWLHRIPGLSWAFHCFAPELFAPYLFFRRFHQLEAICAELDIPLPRLPGRAGVRDRATYCFEVNSALQDFRAEHGMTPDQLSAFLYGFATALVPIEEVDPLPEPTRAWLLLGAPADAEALDTATSETTRHWQGGYDIRPGDLCVMWCRSPRSYVHSIWRATSSGFADPFFYYYRTVWIAKPVKVPNIKFAEIQADPVWSQKPAVRAHFQNSSGKEITREEYDALLGMFAKRGFDTSMLPKLQEVALGLDAAELERESDVEQKLLEPLLEKLGFRTKDWRRQVPLRMGRGIRVYPDYVIGLRGERGDESARAILEAKLRIRTPRDLDEAFAQAASYAARLRADVIGLCAAEGLWLYTRQNGRFRRSTSYELRWADTGDPTHLRRLSELLGGRV